MIDKYRIFSRALSALDVDGAAQILSAVLSAQPQRIRDSKSFYQNEIDRCLLPLGNGVSRERNARCGDPDFTVRLPGRVLVVEIKYAKTTGFSREMKGKPVRPARGIAIPGGEQWPVAIRPEGIARPEAPADADGASGAPSAPLRPGRAEGRAARLRMIHDGNLMLTFERILKNKCGRAYLDGPDRVYAVAVSVVDRWDVSIDCREITRGDWRNDPRPSPLGASGPESAAPS
ncbi:MAG: hypothetical protein LBR80_12075 [Deltaproteobacteria bacterium]|jgi:hypothetical protein|nr:hypothetical protein [Deltaproteobacteria bacterium]